MSAITHFRSQLIAAQTPRKSREVNRARGVRHARGRAALALTFVFTSLSIAFWAVPEANAATTSVNLASASAYAVLAGSTITNTGPSVIAGDIGLSPGTAITGFPPGVQSSGVTNVANAPALMAQADLTAAYLDAASRTPFNTVSGDLGGSTLVPGVYQSASSLALTGTVTLNGGGDASSVFIFKAGSTFVSATGSNVVLENGAQACNVFWQVGSSVTLGTTSQMSGTFMALTSITLNTGAQVSGRVLARNGAVTLDDNAITTPTCAAAVATTTTSLATTTTTVAPTTTTVAPTTTTPRTTTTLAVTTTTAAPASTTTTSPATTTTTTSPATTTTVPTTTTTTPVIPKGPPATGFGGTAGPGSSPRTPLILGSLSLATVAGGLALRERRRNRRLRTDGPGDHAPEA